MSRKFIETKENDVKKIYKFLKEEEIFELMGIFFFFGVLCTTAAANIAPFQMSEEMKTLYYAQYDSLRVWLFVLVPPFVISLVAGIIGSIIAIVRRRQQSIYEIRIPSSENVIPFDRDK